MSIVIGRKYKVDKVILKQHCDKYEWVFEYLSDHEYVTVIDVFDHYDGFKVCHIEEEVGWFYPEGCLIDERYMKLEKILCIK